MAIASSDDVAVPLGRPISSTGDPSEEDQVNYWLDNIELLIRARLGDLTLLDQDVLRYVEVEAVAEKVRRNGRTESSITVHVDDAQVTRTYASVSASDILEDWWKLLDPDIGSRVFSARPQFEDDTDVDWTGFDSP
jgi:hypothetical protein